LVPAAAGGVAVGTDPRPKPGAGLGGGQEDGEVERAGRDPLGPPLAAGDPAPLVGEGLVDQRGEVRRGYRRLAEPLLDRHLVPQEAAAVAEDLGLPGGGVVRPGTGVGYRRSGRLARSARHTG